MLEGKTVGVVVPAYNEERLIRPTLEHVPEFIDKTIVVDDASTDNMPAVVREFMAVDPRIEMIRHETNRGPGAGVITGYKRVLEAGCDIAVVCGGDHHGSRHFSRTDLAEIELIAADNNHGAHYGGLGFPYGRGRTGYSWNQKNSENRREPDTFFIVALDDIL